jgi:4-hydroxy-2-oxoheptanedioate aldolase
MKHNRLRTLWQQDRPAVNAWLSLRDSFAAELMAHQGFDALTVDLQHGLADTHTLLPMLQAIAATPAVPVVRVPWLEAGVLMRVLDAGALGVICPMVNTREEAQRFVAWTTYAPRGTRSYGPLRARLVHGDDYAAQADAAIVRFAMIETAQALDHLDAILSVEGLDAIYIGPSDLSLALGCPPAFDEVAPKVAEAIAHILARAQAHGVVAGIHNGSAAGARARAAAGFRFVTAAADAQLLAAGAQAVLAAMRA